MLGDLLDSAGQGESVDMTIGDQRQQWQIGCNPSGVGGFGDPGQGLCRRQEPLGCGGSRPQPSGA